MEPPLNIDLNIPYNPESEEETNNDPEHYVEESEEEIEIVMFDEDQPQEVYDTNIADIEYDFEDNVQHVNESEPEGVLNADGNVFLLYLISFKFLLSFVRSNYTQYAFQYEGTDNGRKFLSNEERKAIAHLLLQHSHAGRLKKGTRKLIASMYSVSVSVIKRIWKRAKLTGDVSHRKTTNCGRKRIELDHDQFLQVPLSKRSNTSTLSFTLVVGV